MDVKNFTKTVRSAFALGLGLCALAACKPVPIDTGFGSVTGRVVDNDSLQPIPGATITVGNIVSVTAAIDQGGFVLRNVPAGPQTLTISATGWKPYRTQVSVSQSKPVDVGTIGLPSALSP
jgi:carboxypeptidase family protein